MLMHINYKDQQREKKVVAIFPHNPKKPSENQANGLEPNKQFPICFKARTSEAANTTPCLCFQLLTRISSNSQRGLAVSGPKFFKLTVNFFPDKKGFCFEMGNNVTTVKEEREEIRLKIVPALDKVYVRWLARDLQRVHGFKPKNVRAITPPDSYIEFMRLNGSLDVDLDDPDLAHLFK